VCVCVCVHDITTCVA